MTRRIVYLHGFASGPDSKKARFFQERFRAENMELEIPDLAEEGRFERLTITGQLRVVERVASGRPVSLHRPRAWGDISRRSMPRDTRRRRSLC